MPTTADILNAFEKVMERAVKKTGRPPYEITPAMFWMHCKGEVTEWQLRSRGGYFSIRDGLYPQPKEEEKIFVPDKEKSAHKIRNKSRYVVTAAQAGVAVNMHFFRSLLNYCKAKKADLMIIPLEGKSKEDTVYDPKIVPYLIHSDTKLNKNVKVSLLGIKPTVADPLNGLCRFTDHSTIFGSPKLAMQVVPVSNCKIPKAIMTTGAITQPNYNGSKVGRIARQDHVYSAIVVEVVDSKMFHYRQLVADEAGDFCDLDKKYTPNKIEKSEVAAIVLGDLHLGSIDPKVLYATKELVELVEPEVAIDHDINDSYSVTNHHANNITIRAKKAEKRLNDLRTEYESVYKFLVEQAKSFKKIIVVSSNHDDMVDRFLKSGAFIDDPQNYRISLELSLGLLDGMTAMETFMRKRDAEGKIKNVKFLKTSDDHSIEGVVISNHGHLGANGAKGSVKTQEIGARSAIVGHSHAARIYHRIWVVGTSTYLKLEYNEGFSGWTQTHCLLFKNGTRQLVNFIEGKWKL